MSPPHSTCVPFGTKELEVSVTVGAHLHCSPSLLAIVEYEILIESFRTCLSIEQEKAEKADQNPKHRTENSEPEWNV
jgi:hypothetical protein